MTRNPYIAIMRAADKGMGIRLSADEVIQMSMDNAVETYAVNCLNERQQEQQQRGGWAAVTDAGAALQAAGAQDER